ncbi:MAG: hypothetical protein J7K85_03045 [Anaerolineaceae bacterium]|nr:hypothetical protein [Anaerolineaceae bacterium]
MQSHKRHTPKKQKPINLLLLLLLVVGVILILIPTVTSSAVSNLPITLHSIDEADYSSDTVSVIPKVDLNIIQEIIWDDVINHDDYEKRLVAYIENLAKPIPTATSATISVGGTPISDTVAEESNSQEELATETANKTPSITVSLSPTVTPSPTTTHTLTKTGTNSVINTPTKTATNTPTKTATSTLTNLATNTPLPPTATLTPINSATNTPLPPTATRTNTPLPPTPTNTAVTGCTDPLPVDGVLPDGYVVNSNPAPNASNVSISISTVTIFYNQAMMDQYSGGGVRNVGNYHMRTAVGGDDVGVLSITYNPGLFSATFSFDNSDDDWLPDTKYEIQIKKRIENNCGTDQDKDVYIYFTTAP